MADRSLPRISPIATLDGPAGAITAEPAAAAVVDEVLRRLDLRGLDVLEIDLASGTMPILEDLPLARLMPTVIDCALWDAEDGPSWRDAATFLKARGYAVYVSEWHASPGEGEHPDWRRIAPYTDELEIRASATGRILAFRDDPGWPAVRRAFHRFLERRPVRAQARSAAAAAAKERTLGGEGSVAEAAGPVAIAAASGAPSPMTVADAAARTAGGAGAPKVERRRPLPIRLGRRALRGAWRRRRLTLPLALLLLAWVFIGFLPVLAPMSVLVWGSATIAGLGLLGLGAAYMAVVSARRLGRDVRRLKRDQEVSRRLITEANARIRRLEIGLADASSATIDLSRKLARLEDAGVRSSRSARKGGRSA